MADMETHLKNFENEKWKEDAISQANLELHVGHSMKRAQCTLELGRQVEEDKVKAWKAIMDDGASTP